MFYDLREQAKESLWRIEEATTRQHSDEFLPVDDQVLGLPVQLLVACQKPANGFQNVKIRLVLMVGNLKSCR